MNNDNTLFDPKEIHKVLKMIISTAGIFTGVMFLILFFMPPTFINRALVFLAVAAACMLGGMAIGFLFGIPRTEKFRYKPDKDREQRDFFYADNTNLEEISDWLTKIIVGLTLVKFQTLLLWIHQSALSMSQTLASIEGCKDDCHRFYVFSYAIMILYFLIGTAIGYLWTRVKFSQILTANRNFLSKLELSKKEQLTGQKNYNQELFKLNRYFIGEINDGVFSEFISRAERENRERKITTIDDLQKGRWGGMIKNNGYVITADVKDSEFKGWYDIAVTLYAEKGGKTINDIAAFFLHDTFPETVLFIKPDSNGLLKFTITAYEAFTMGAMLADGTELELDLNKEPGYPENFYWKE